MILTHQDMKKIDTYYGFSKAIIKKLQFWVHLNPKDKFCVDEIIEWLEQQKTFSTLY